MNYRRKRKYSKAMRCLATAGITLVLSACASNAGRSAGSIETRRIQVGERTRDYLLYTPRSLQNESSQKHALVIVFHGGGGTSRQIMRETGEGFFRLAEKDGFYVLFPNAVDKLWDFAAGWTSSELDERIDDRSYFGQILDDAIAQLAVDPERVFATGISRGGQASYYIACEFPGRIRAIAPVAMPLPVFMTDSCSSGPPVGIALMNGTEDPLVPYAGGTITVGKKKRDEVLSTTETIALWIARNGCNPAARLESTLNAARDRMHVELSEWRDCSGADVLLYRIVGGGHTWPSGSQYLPAFLVGRVNRDIDATEIAWAFFNEFR